MADAWYRRRMRLALVVLALGGCAGARGGGGGAAQEATFRVFYPDQPADGFKAKVGTRFIVEPVATCTYANGRDARWSMTGSRLETGDLPPGFKLEEGAIAGTPSAPGAWSVKIRFAGVTCAGTPHDDVIVPVIITAR